MNKLSKVQEFIDEYWNKKTRDQGLFELFNENIISRTFVGKRIGRQSYQHQSKDWDHSFPDHFMKLESSEVIENTIIINYNSTGTFSKPYVDSKINALEDGV